MDLYPTLEVVPATAKTAAYLAHSSVPVSFTDEDFEQVLAGNFLVKVIYLPDPAFQDLAAVAGPAEVISTRLEPGVDPIAEGPSSRRDPGDHPPGQHRPGSEGYAAAGCPEPVRRSGWPAANGPDARWPADGPAAGWSGCGVGPSPRSMPPVKLPE